MIQLRVEVFGDNAEFNREVSLVDAKRKYRVALNQLDEAYKDAREWLDRRITEEVEKHR